MENSLLSCLIFFCFLLRLLQFKLGKIAIYFFFSVRFPFFSLFGIAHRDEKRENTQKIQHILRVNGFLDRNRFSVHFVLCCREAKMEQAVELMGD